MKRAFIANVMFLVACSPAPQEASAPAREAAVEVAPALEPLPSVPVASATLDEAFNVSLARYVQSVAVCDHLSPGLLDAAKAELRASLGPDLWSSEEEASTDYFRDGEGARMAGEMRAAIRAGGPGTQGILRRACSRGIADNKRLLIRDMQAIIDAAHSNQPGRPDTVEERTSAP
jgi:hypothetical protein